MNRSRCVSRAAARLVSAVALAWWCSAGTAHAGDVGQITSTVCINCHGEGGNSLVPTFPKLAGQQPAYLAKQLTEFLSGKRKNDVMAAFLPNITAGDVPGLAAYYAAQKQTPGTVADAALAAAGQKIFDDGNTDTGVPACAGCHQPKGEGNERFPRLAGQHQAYVLQQMTDFKNGVRTNDKGKIMRAVAERMTEQEMKAVSEYIAGL